MNRRVSWTLSAVSASLLLVLIVVPSSRAQVVRISKSVLLLPKALLSLPPKALGSAMLRSPVLAAAREQESGGVITGSAYHHDTSPPLRDMKPVGYTGSRGETREANENPKVPVHHNDSPDGVVQSFHVSPSAMPPPILNFDGIPFPGVVCNCAPPDTDGEVGSTQYVQIVNEGYQVFNKTTGASVLGPLAISTIWTGFGGFCEFNGHGDPVVLYDQIANRWVVSQFAGVGIPTDECIAVSTTDDATLAYNRYGFHLGSNFFDYPHIGVWPDAYYMSMNVFNSAGTAFLGPQPFAFDRAAMIAGLAATFVSTGITGGPGEDAYLPSDLDGSNLPPAGAPATFVEFPSTGVYKVFHMHADFAVPANTTFTLFASPPAAGFALLCPTTRACVPQLGSGDGLDGIADRLMFRLPYRNFGDHESLVGNFTVLSGGVAGIRWFELRGVTSGPVSVFQESTYQPDTTWRWMGSVAQDFQGNMALGFSASSSVINPQIRYAGRLSTDALGVLAQGEAHLFDGTGSQLDTVNRWGDYSDMTIDPVDDCTFWYTQEYYATTSSFNWRTRIGNFKFPGCVIGTPTPTITGTRTATPTPTNTFTATLTPTPTPSPAPVCTVTEGFNDVTVLPGWFEQNNSQPLGTIGWFQGNSAVFPAQAGAPTAYIAANFNNGSGLATLSNWLLTPPLMLQTGGQLTFWTRTVDAPIFPDRLQVRMSLNGFSTDVGTTATSVGDFTALLLDINPTYLVSGYPNAWTQFTVNLTGIGSPTTGRLAFRYFVENGGPAGANSDYIGIDTVQFACTGGPTPTNTPTGTLTATPTATPTACASAWQVVANMPLDLYGAGLTSNGTFVYAAGGYSFSTGTSVSFFNRYDPVANTWTPLAPLADTLSTMTSAVYSPINNKVYVFGGEDANTGINSNATRIYDIATNAWSAGANMPDVRSFMASGYNTANNKIYLVTGYNTGQVTSAQPQVWEYDPATNTFNTAKTPIPHATGGPGFGIINGHLYVAGGRDATNTVIALTWDYNIAADTWTAKANMPAPDNVPGSAAAGGKLWVFGGGNPFGPIQGTESRVPLPDTTNAGVVYDPATDTWGSAPNLNVGRSFTSGATVGTKLVAAGGYNGATTVATTETLTVICATPTPTSTTIPSITPTVTPSITPSITPTNAPSITVTNTRTNTRTNTPTNTVPPVTNTFTNTPTNTPTVTPTACVVSATPVSEGFESGLGGFVSVVPTCVPGGCGWSAVTTDKHSGAQSAFAPDRPNISDQLLVLSSGFPVPASATSAVLSFWHRVALESTFDGGVLEFSTDNGVTWSTSDPTFITGGYNATISTSFGSPIGGRHAWSGTIGSAGNFVNVQVNLISFAGQSNLKFRFREANDNSVSATGWWVDDVLVTILTPCPTPTPTPTPANLLTDLSPAKVWVGLTNSDDVGIRFDLKAIVSLNGSTVGSGQLDSVAGGSSGFNNAKLNSILLSVTPTPVSPGDLLAITLYERNACLGSGKNSGRARLWYNGQPIDVGVNRDAGSRFDATIGGTNRDYFLRSGFALNTTAGAAKATIDVAAGAKCSPFVPFGTWKIALP